jgi:hypothetical protein
MCIDLMEKCVDLATFWAFFTNSSGHPDLFRRPGKNGTNFFAADIFNGKKVVCKSACV